ncbi:hypothetical protein D9619_011922 [Psilocybe cf. subviscida]|uniref:Uncharacterized protein n=1 Tax=Psilocybe cf. subviscida TaxID=2480587 RepID=A0A8H5EVY3_9AGAR|nr:hypothetical protein D9619_011922 [Psilocybe cf. subviscida]
MSTPIPQDELTSTICGAVQQLNHDKKANFLLDTSLALIETGRYGPDVDNYVEVFLRTPGVSRRDMTKALLARGNARKQAGERLLAKAQEDFQAVLRIDPTNKELHRVRSSWKRTPQIHFSHEPASHRAPVEIWERIASHTPRYHIRTWLSISSMHREIALQHIFHTLDIYFGEDLAENVNRGLDIFDRAKEDPVFASRVKSLRLHWAYEEGEMLDLMARIFRTALPAFKSLRDFEWIGYPEMRADMVKAVLRTHKHLHGLGLIGWHFDAEGVSEFRNLRKFTLRAEDDDGWADMGEVRKVLDHNEKTLRHLILGAYLERQHSWDLAFGSVTIKNLTHLDLVDTRISHDVISRIAHAHNLQGLTLHGMFEDAASAAVVFGSDHVIDGKHTFLPHLESFRFVLVGHDDDHQLYNSVIRFLRQRKSLRRLDLGSCPWDLVLSLLPELSGLRVLGVRIANLTQAAVTALTKSIPEEMLAITLSTVISEKPLNEYARSFTRFSSLSFLHFLIAIKRRPKPNLMSEKEFQLQTDMWLSNARSIATVVPSLDFLGWHGEHFVVVRTDPGYGNAGVELKELPSRRRLDCGKGVDLGGDDAAWLERKDVPMDYERPGLD